MASCIWVGLLMAVLCIGVQHWEISKGNENWGTMVFTIIAWSQLMVALAVRSEKESFFKLGLFTNKAMLGAVIVGVLLQLAVIYIPVLNPIFYTKPLTAGELLLCTILAFGTFGAIEIAKFIKRRRE